MTGFSDLKTSLKIHEGCVTYMYLDTEGHVTIGMGSSYE
jgi:GH24 family phage-related lysozyme (muramidase)